MKYFILLITLISLLACEETEEAVTVPDANKQEIKQIYENAGIFLDEAQLNKLTQIYLIFAKHGVNLKLKPSSSEEKRNALLSINIWEIEKKAIGAKMMKMQADSITVITKYWEPFIKASNIQNRDSIYRLYHEEQEIMRQKIHRIHEQELKALKERKQRQNH